MEMKHIVTINVFDYRVFVCDGQLYHSFDNACRYCKQYFPKHSITTKTADWSTTCFWLQSFGNKTAKFED